MYSPKGFNVSSSSTPIIRFGEAAAEGTLRRRGEGDSRTPKMGGTKTPKMRDSGTSKAGDSRTPKESDSRSKTPKESDSRSKTPKVSDSETLKSKIGKMRSISRDYISVDDALPKKQISGAEQDPKIDSGDTKIILTERKLTPEAIKHYFDGYERLSHGWWKHIPAGSTFRYKDIRGNYRDGGVVENSADLFLGSDNTPKYRFSVRSSIGHRLYTWTIEYDEIAELHYKPSFEYLLIQQKLVKITDEFGKFAELVKTSMAELDERIKHVESRS
jgi:hypothetical protein